MRVRRLELVRYGHFTNEPVDLPPAEPDLHIVFGPNEAGKSTVMSALEDLLFGIPARSPLNFLHDYRDMRIAGILESDGRSLSVQRRKGTKNTLLSADDVPFPNGERVLAPFIGDASRERLERVFSLDHARLRRGGREILEAKGDVGEALFSAGSGLQDLHKCRRDLDDEADELWSRRRSARRRYYQASDRLEAANHDLRAQTVSAATWRELKGRYEACRTADDQLRKDLEAKESELRKVGRIRRQARFVQDKLRLEDEIRRLGDISGLPNDARETLQRAEQDLRFAAQRIDECEIEIKQAKSDRAALSWDESLLLRADDIERLYERWIQVQTGKADLPKREAELATEEGKLRALARELGWTDDSVSGLLARIPLRSGVAKVRALLTQRTELLAEVRSARGALRDAETRLADTKRRLDGIDAPADVSRLSALVSATKRDFGDIGSQVRAAESELAESEAEVQAVFGGLRPQPESSEIAASLVAPPKGQVQVHRDQRLDLDHRLAQCRERLRSTENELAALENGRDRIKANEQPVSRKDVVGLRKARDSGWALVRRKHIEGEAVSEGELRRFAGNNATLAEAYESAVQAADRGADRSVETASATARLRQADESIERQRDRLGSLQAELRHLSERSEAMDCAWKELWVEAAFSPLGPDAMLAWLDSRESIRQALARRADRQLRLATLRKHETGAIEAVATELQSLGVEVASVQDKGLLVLLELAVGEQQRHEQAARARAELEVGSRQAATEVATKREQAERAVSAETEWESEWSSAVNHLGFSQGANPETIGAQADVIDEMRLIQAEITNLRDKRISLIRRDIADFEGDLRKVAGSTVPGLAGKDPDDATPELRRLLERSREVRDAALAKDRHLATLEARLRSHEEARRKARDDIFALQAVAGVETVEGLKLEIQKAERAERCRSELSEVIEKLRADGDGLTVEKQQEECLGVDLDEAASREQALLGEIEDLRQRQLVARDTLREAEAAYSAVGSGGAAALAEGARQSALAEIAEIAGQYIRIRSSALLLQWAIERNRRERQAPMLKRAGRLFAELTLGSFEALELDFDEKDQGRLVGRRPSGERVEVEGMSSGSADQLYLALRVAALEDYFDGAQPLPFVADDLFINFDDERSAAGLRVLNRLARRCQVIFFTHHEHLLEVANEAIPESARVWRMAS